MSLGRALRDRRHARWLDKARRGDGEAFRLLYRELFPPVTGYLALRVAHREDVEDLTSQVFHRFLENLHRFDRGRGSVLSWVLTMAHHAMVDHHRRNRRVLLDGVAELGPVQLPEDPLERLLREEGVGVLLDALAGLEPVTRRMFEMRYEMDMTYREIAGLLEISEDSVKQRFSRVHRKLRAVMEQERDSHHG